MMALSTSPPHFFVHKAIGETPLEALDRARRVHGIPPETKLGYAGRLDPMESGLLLVLVGDENKHKKRYEQWRKTYTVDILFGISTDSHDILGLITAMKRPTEVSPDFSSDWSRWLGVHDMQYPVYSAKRVQGKPLFWWARRDKLAEISIPHADVELFEIRECARYTLSGQQILRHVRDTIPLVHGDFRQDAVMQSWQKAMQDVSDVSYPVVRISVTCGPGTFMRWLAVAIGQSCGYPACAWSIERTALFFS